MPMPTSFRQVDEKHVSTEVELMLWSPKMDLIAISNVQGEVLLYRLTWQKVWTLPAPVEEVKVQALVWRPDGKVLAVGYSNGQVDLCDVENASKLHSLQLSAAVSSAAWVAEVAKSATGGAASSPEGMVGSVSAEQKEGPEEERDCFQDLASHYLPRLPQFAKSYATLSKGPDDDSAEDTKKLKGQADLNLLLLGAEDGHLHMYAFGVFPVSLMDLNQHGIGKSGKLLSANLSEDLHLLCIVVESLREDGETKEVYLVSFDTTLLASRHRELRLLALKFGEVLTLIAYLDSTIQQMIESWEDILLEMDSKLMKLADEKYSHEGSVSNDFLKLLMFGTPSERLQNFLLNDLTEKGLKKLGHSIDTLYSNIQKLVLKHLQSVGQALVYHLADIRGMSEWYDRFGVLGLSTATIVETTCTAGAFMLKASELQQVIDSSMRNFKAFFRWLYVAIQKLSDEPIPPEFSKVTQQDLNFVAQFLKDNFTEDIEDNKSGFKLEKVGQYLKEEDLLEPPPNNGNPWVDFLKMNSNIQKSSLLYPCHPEKSLLQMHHMLQDSITGALDRCATGIGKSLQCVSTVLLYRPYVADGKKIFTHRISQFSKAVAEQCYMYTVFTVDNIPCDKCQILRQSTTPERKIEVVSMEFGQLGSLTLNDSNSSNNCSRHVLLDLSHYDVSTLSVLLQEDVEDCLPVLAQVPLVAVETGHNFVQVTGLMGPLTELEGLKCVDVAPYIDGLNCRRLDNMRAAQFAVSGTRKVACVLFSSKRRVRLYMMDAEDEEEDEEEDVEEEDASRNDEGMEETSREEVTEAETSQDLSQSSMDGEENKENTMDV